MGCIICGMKKNGRGRPCKLCGMRTTRSLSYNNFIFCCKGCILAFRKIIKNATPAEREAALGRRIMI